MKNVLYVLIFVLLASSVCAVASFNVNDLEFGSTSQQPGTDVVQTLHVVNDGNETLTINLASNMPSNYNVRFSQTSITLNSGASTDVTVTIFVPLTQASGRNQVSGGITATSNAVGLSKTIGTYVTVFNFLEIYKVSMSIDDEDRSLHRGDTFSSDIIKAGKSVTFTVYVRNNYNSAQDIDINDIDVDIRSSGDLDLDESDSFDDLQYGDRDQISFSATIPSDAEDGDNYDIDVTVTGRTQNGVLLSDRFNTGIEVKRVSHEISFKSFSLSPQTITCKGKATINTELKNTGRSTEDKVHLEIINADLGLDQRFTGMSLKEDDTVKKSYSFSVDNSTEPGQYDIILTSFYNSDTESEVQVLTLNVEPCTQTVTTPTTPTVINPGNNVPTIPQVVPTNGATPVYGSASFTDSPTYLIILVAAVVVILLILIILLVKFVF